MLTRIIHHAVFQGAAGGWDCWLGIGELNERRPPPFPQGQRLVMGRVGVVSVARNVR